MTNIWIFQKITVYKNAVQNMLNIGESIFNTGKRFHSHYTIKIFLEFKINKIFYLLL